MLDILILNLTLLWKKFPVSPFNFLTCNPLFRKSFPVRSATDCRLPFTQFNYGNDLRDTHLKSTLAVCPNVIMCLWRKEKEKNPLHVNDMTRGKKDRWLRFVDWTHIHNGTCHGCQSSQQAWMRRWQQCVPSSTNWLKFIHVYASHFAFWYCLHEAFWSNTAANPRPSVPDMWWILIEYTSHSHMHIKQETSWCASAASLRALQVSCELNFL